MFASVVILVAAGWLAGGCAGTVPVPAGGGGGYSLAELRMVPARGLPPMVLRADGTPIEDPGRPFRLSPGVHKLTFTIDGKRHLLFGNFSPAGRYVIEIRSSPGGSYVMELRPA